MLTDRQIRHHQYISLSYTIWQTKPELYNLANKAPELYNLANKA